MDEVRNVSPESLVTRIEVDRIAKAFALHIHPDFTDALGCQFAFATLTVNAAFKLVKGDLAHDRIDHVLGFLSQHGLAFALVLGAFKQRPEGEHFTEHGCGFRKCKRRRCH